MTVFYHARKILKGYKIHNASVLVREDVTVDQFIDTVLGNRRYIKCIYCYNKIDQVCILFILRKKKSMI